MSGRIVIAGTSSGAGKTTIACGLINALTRRGLTVQGFKVGPDYIDPSHHALASGRPPRNLDAFMSGPDLIAPLFAHGARGADLSIIEGVMGMFDGASGRGELASTAHVAKLLRAPIVLVVDAAAMSRSAGAIVFGFRDFDPEIDVAGVIFNKVGSDHHEQLLREAVEPLGVPVLGVLRRDERVATPERHLGLVPVAERETHARKVLEALSSQTERQIDLAALLKLAEAGDPLTATPWSPEPAEPVSGTRVALSSGPACSFHYTENLELLEAAGAELRRFDPLVDEALPPDCDALILAGGFPEVFAPELSENSSLRDDVAAFARRGQTPVLAECGGLLYLCEQLDDHQMCGVLPATARMSKRLTLGYREATAATVLPWLPAGAEIRGHEFHYGQIKHAQDLPAAWSLEARGRKWQEGFARGSVQASFLHQHWAAVPEIPSRLLRAASRARALESVS